jgi:hypothetical protein
MNIKTPAGKFVRFNAQVSQKQREFIRKEAKKLKIGECKTFRGIIDYYIANKK